MNQPEFITRQEYPHSLPDPRVTVLHGDWIARLRELPDASVQCIVTSPPYWGLRDYGVAGQLGLEKTPEEYVAKIVAGFRECFRVLREDGTLWLNLGDRYASSTLKWGGSQGNIPCKQNTNRGSKRPVKAELPAGIKRKDLIGIPWRVAFALQAEGWYLRADNIWAKPNPMPESVTDRPTRSHEYLFLFSKRERYFYDAEAIKEPSIEHNWSSRYDRSSKKSHPNGERNGIRTDKQRGHSRRHTGFNDHWDQMEKAEQCSGLRNKRSVWFISPAPYRGAHFATFPPKLIEPCILAGTSEIGGCAQCGAPYRRIVRKGIADLAHQRACGGDINGHYQGTATKDFAAAKAQNASAVKASILQGLAARETAGWQTTCKHPIGKPKPCVVLDPFGGSGTVGQVSQQHGRDCILIELNPEYLPLIQERVTPH